MKRILTLGLLALLAAGSMSTSSAWADKRDDVLRKRAQIQSLIDRGLYVPGERPMIWNGARYVRYTGDPINANYGNTPPRYAYGYGNNNYNSNRYMNVPNGNAWGWRRNHPNFRYNNRWEANRRVNYPNYRY